MFAISTSSLSKYYTSKKFSINRKKSRGILDLNLTVSEGDFFGFIGPNGAGKSTTIRTLLGLISPTSGTAEIFGKDITRQKSEILPLIGYMPSEAFFYNSQKVKDILKLSADLRKKDCAAQAVRLCERLSLDTEKKISELSLGNRKKVSIVCALQHMPKLCILDEPTSGLDPLVQREFYAILEERNRQGSTIFLSSHVLSEVQRYCKHAAIIREGKILVSESVKHLGHTNTKRVTVRGISKLPSLPHIKDIQQNGDSFRFLYSGKPDLLLNALAKLPLTDISITEPDLEEIFLHYYEKETT